MLEQLNKELSRCLDALSETNPTSKSYDELLERIGNLNYLINSFMQRAEKNEACSEDTVKTTATPVAEPKAEVSDVKAPKKNRSKTKIEPQPEVVENTEVEPVEEAENDKPTYEEVRAALAQASANGIKVKDLLTKYVPDGKDARLTSVPTDRYAELLKEVTEYAG